MILVDANLLIFATNVDAPEHQGAKRWLDEQLSGPTRVGLPWPSLLAFLRIATNASALRHPLTAMVAWQQVLTWLRPEVVWIPVPGDRHVEIAGRFFEDQFMSSRLVSDAHLAALAIEHGLTLCSTDGDFAKFPGLRWENPLAA